MTRPRRISLPSLVAGVLLGLGVSVVPFAVASGDGAAEDAAPRSP